eukprot:4133767-Amphidinium_carterae.1
MADEVRFQHCTAKSFADPQRQLFLGLHGGLFLKYLLGWWPGSSLAPPWQLSSCCAQLTRLMNVTSAPTRTSELLSLLTKLQHEFRSSGDLQL